MAFDEKEVVILKDDDEEIISIDDLEKEEPTQTTPVEEEKKSKPFNKKNFIFIGVGIGVFVAIILIFVLIFGKSSSHEATVIPSSKTENIEKEILTYKFNKTKIDDLIQKANSVYETGNKTEALKIYENVAIYNESLSYYNLGVSQMKQDKYKEAIESFKKAITNKENADVGALNAAVCALHLNDLKAFKYYIDVAYTFLSINSKSYKYYAALINYYKGYYAESLKILQTIEDENFDKEKNYLKAKILSLFKEDEKAIIALNQTSGYDTHLPLGLLYARLGQYEDAERHLMAVQSGDENYLKARLAMSLINLKHGKYGTAASMLKSINDFDEKMIANTYNIKVLLRPDFFDIYTAQKNFTLDTFFNKQTIYAMIFYFTPYKVYDTTQTINYIRKGSLVSFVEKSGGDEYLKTSGVISNINARISRAIATALQNNLKQAKDEFTALLKNYNGHSILHYNLGLVYAKLEDFGNAYKHFVTGYHLDPSNHLAGIYAIMSGEIIGKDIINLSEEVSENLNADNSLNTGNIYETLLFLVKGNKGAINRWLDEDDNSKVFNVALGLLFANMLNRKDIINKKSHLLKESLKDDLMANILYFLPQYNGDIKEFARVVHHNFFNNDLYKNTIYKSAQVVKLQFIKLLQIAGLLDVQRRIILSDLQASPDDLRLKETLAYLDLFTQNYEEAYEIYKDLVNIHKYTDGQTLFSASVASVGAKHPETAIAYLELARLTNPTEVENRITLGLLYQEVGNIQAALSMYSGVGDTEYKNRFFTFILK